MKTSALHYHSSLPCFVFLILFLVLNFPFAIFSDASEEANALLKWKTSLHQNQLNSSILPSWTLHPINATFKTGMCSWFGVNCSQAGSVIAISLQNTSLKGTLQEFSFSSFSELVSIDLSYNELSGTIPPEITKLSKLKWLSLNDNQFSGKIPPEVGLMSHLENMFLYSNQLAGSIPSSLSNLTNLVRLYLSYNSLSGCIPPSIGNLKSLHDLDLSGNHLSGSIPLSLGNLSSLSYFYLYDNSLSGSIPSTIGNLKFLLHLELSSNQLIDYIPYSLNNLTSLVRLVLFENKLTGHLPRNICQSGSLELLNIGDNNFLGPIPRSLRNCKNLVRARLQRNNFNGNISEDIGFYPNLHFLDLSDNRFYGEISSNWGQCPQLSSLNISVNKVSGSISPEIGNSSQLERLDLSSNGIVGEIPIELGKLTSLYKVILKGNKLSGRLPRELGSLTKLEYLDLSNNILNDSIPESIGYLLKLFYLNLSNNHFNQIPTKLEKLVQLSILDLSHNMLSGEMPSQICNMESLENLNLSYNNLSGLIPDCFEVMHGLSNINISYNKLWGPIPNSTAFRNASIQELQGNVGLCGDVKGLSSCKRVFMSHRKSSKKIWIVVVFPLLGALGLFILVISVFFIFGRKNKDLQKQEKKCVNTSELLSVLTFDGAIMHEEIIRATNDFDPKYCIGKGGQGSVYRVELPSTNTLAVKKFHSPFSGEIVIQQEFLNEIKALTKIRHRNIVRFYGFCSHTRHSFLVYKYLERGSLATILRNNALVGDFGWKMRINVIKGVADALSYLHHDCFPSIVHRDISSKNVLLDSEYEARVSDFGIAKFLNPNSSNWTEFAGTHGYAAPEFAYTMKVTEKCDVYSFGVLALEVINGKHPRDCLSSISSSSPNMNISLDQVLDPRLPYPSFDVQSKLTSIMNVAFLCVDTNPNSRPIMYKVSQLLCM